MEYQSLEKEAEKKFKTRDKKKRKRMKVSGKSVFTLARLAHERTGKKILKLKKKK